MKKNRKLIFIVTILLGIALLLSTAGITYAAWRNRRTANQTTPVPAEDWNESLQYQVFALLGEDGEVLPAGHAAADAFAAALTGYTGLIERVVVPETVSIAVSGVLATVPVTKVLIPAQGTPLYQNGGAYHGSIQIGFGNNQFVTELKLPAALVYICRGAFQSMTALEKLSLAGEGELTVGEYAFFNLTKLTPAGFFCEREIIGNRARIFQNTRYE